jgi:ribosome biogenesis GTPase / thiamine phosphate phosphatase
VFLPTSRPSPAIAASPICRHETEPGCAIQAALADSRIDADRLRRYRKLAAEDARNSQSLHERHAKARSFGRMTKRIVAEKQDRWRK